MLIFTTLLALAAGYVLFQMSRSSDRSGQKELKPIRIRTDEQQRRRR